MDNSMTASVGAALSDQQSAVRNAASPSSKIKLVLMWLAVGLPLLWGAMKALEDIGSLPL
jgi:hypothetical protein